jgi:serine/threonine protein phosphatase PrpC
LLKEVSQAEIAQALQQGACQESCNELLELTLSRGARDNVTVVVIDFNKLT